MTNINEDDKAGVTVITRMNEMTGVAGMTRITGIAMVTLVTGMTRVGGIIKVNDSVTGIPDD